MTYNILSQKYIDTRNNKDLKLGSRALQIINEISSLQPDIICLQEVALSILPSLREKLMNLNYSSSLQENLGSPLYNTIFYKSQRFKMISGKSVDITDINCEGNRGVQNLILEDKIDNRFFSIYNAHFPWRPIYDTEKALIMARIMHDIKDSNIKFSFVCGDFNSLPYSLVLRLVYFKEFCNELSLVYCNRESFKKEEKALLEEFLNKFEEFFGHIVKYGQDKEFLKAEESNERMKGQNKNEKFVLKGKFSYLFFRDIKSILENEINSKEFFKALLISEYFNRTMNFGSVYEDYKLIINDDYHLIHNKDHHHCLINYQEHHPEYTNYTIDFKENIDYIFYPKTHFTRQKLLKIPIITDKSLPSSNYPSDHLKLYCEFVYK